MGIRVHKVLGWGLYNLEPGERGAEDPRVNWESPLVKYEGLSGQEYFRWLEAKRRASQDSFMFSMDWAVLAHSEGFAERNLQDCFTYQPEFGLPEVLMLTPFSRPDWRRSDDTIDYLTESYQLPGEGIREPAMKDQPDHVAVLPNAPYPFNGMFMDKRTGERLSKSLDWVRIWNSLGRHRIFEEGSEQRRMLDLLAQAAGLAGHDEAAEVVVPLVPDEIRDLAEFGQMFTGPDVWLQLRPLLYTFWG
jgi:hypothetical protein